MSRISIDVVSHRPDLSPFRDIWEQLYARTPGQPSTSFEWTDAMTRSHLKSDDVFRLIQLRRGTTVIGLVPLVARSTSLLGYSIVALSPLAELYNTHSDLITGEMSDETIAAFIAALPSLDVGWDLFRMSRILTDHPLLRAVDDKFGDSRITGRVRSGEPSYYLTLPRSFEAYLFQRSGKFRNYLKRVERRIADRGDATIIEIVEPGQIAASYDLLLEVERGSWKHAHGTSISAVARQTRFYRDLCEGAAAAGRLHLQILTLGGQPAAYNLGLLDNGCYSYLKTSFSEGFKGLGVATYLRARLVQRLIERGVTELDFPAEPYEWERQWTDTVRWHKVLTLYAPTATGRVLACIDRMRHRDVQHQQIVHVDPRALQRVASQAVH